MHKIKWKKGDAVRLGREIARFNRIAKNTGLDLQYNFKELKGEILSREELNRRIKSLKRLTYENAGNYQKKEFDLEKRRALTRLKKELKKTPKSKFLVSDDQMMIEGEINNIKNWDKLTPWFKKKKIERVRELARADYGVKVADNYRNWYLKTVEDYYSNFKGYDKLMKKLNQITNPQNFYDRIKGDVNASDIYYLRYGNASQEQFNKILRAWGLGDYEAEFEEVYGGF